MGAKKKQLVIRYYIDKEHDEPHDSLNTTRDADMTSQEASEKSFPVASDHTLLSGSSAAAASSNVSLVMGNTTLIQSTSQRSEDHSPEATVKPKPTVRSCLPDLIAMTRPSNLPGVVLFHMLGTYLALQNGNYWKFLFQPSMMVTLVALVLTSSTSMLVNDYYDFKLGHDSMKPFQPLNTPSRLPLNVAKRFLSYLYAAALLFVTIVPGVPARMAVIMGLMLTFWYTQHLKPRTWLKNAVCASLIALSPLTSGVATMSLTGTSVGWTPLFRVVSMLFVGILGREITMDINDVGDDQNHGVRTVPVVYGRKFASSIGLVCSLVVAGLAVAGPLVQSISGEFTARLLRRLSLALIGSAAQVRRGWQVFHTEGQDPEVVNKAVDEGLLTVVLLLASFV